MRGNADTIPLALMSNVAGSFASTAVSHLGGNQCKSQSYRLNSQKRGKTGKRAFYTRHDTTGRGTRRLNLINFCCRMSTRWEKVKKGTIQARMANVMWESHCTTGGNSLTSGRPKRSGRFMSFQRQTCSLPVKADHLMPLRKLLNKLRGLASQSLVISPDFVLLKIIRLSKWDWLPLTSPLFWDPGKTSFTKDGEIR